MSDDAAQAKDEPGYDPGAALAARCSNIQAAMGELRSALVGDREPTSEQVVLPTLNIATAIAFSLAEIADGVQRIAAAREAELAWAIQSQHEVKAEAEAERKKAEENRQPKRRFLGQRD